MARAALHTSWSLGSGGGMRRFAEMWVEEYANIVDNKMEIVYLQLTYGRNNA